METHMDCLVLQLADKDQILAVRQRTQSPQSTVFYKEAQKVIGLNREMGEEIYALQPDIVFFGPWSGRNTQKMLEKLGVHTERPKSPKSWEDLWEEFRYVGKVIEHPEKAEYLIEQMQQRLRRIESKVANTPPKRAIYYVANGITRGDKTIVDSMLKSAGLTNVATEIGIQGMGRLNVEKLALLKPDVIVFTDYCKDSPSLSRQLLSHPIFDELTKNATIVELHFRDFNSPGMPYIDCVEQLARAAHPETFHAK
jgi:iron complex transport system substrate-binding protein